MLINNDQIERRLVRLERALTIGFTLLNGKVAEKIPGKVRDVLAKEITRLLEEISFDVKAFYDAEAIERKNKKLS